MNLLGSREEKELTSEEPVPNPPSSPFPLADLQLHPIPDSLTTLPHSTDIVEYEPLQMKDEDGREGLEVDLFRRFDPRSCSRLEVGEMFREGLRVKRVFDRLDVRGLRPSSSV